MRGRRAALRASAAAGARELRTYAYVYVYTYRGARGQNGLAFGFVSARPWPGRDRPVITPWAPSKRGGGATGRGAMHSCERAAGVSRGVTLTPTLTLALTKCVLECVAAWNARVCSSVCWSACGSVECAAALQPCTPIYACRRPARAACGLGAGVFAPPTPKGMYASGSHGRTPADIGLTTGNKKETRGAGAWWGGDAMSKLHDPSPPYQSLSTP